MLSAARFRVFRPALPFFESGGRVRCSIEAEANGGTLILWGQNNKPTVQLSSDSNFGLRLYDGKKQTHVTESGIEMADSTGDPRIGLVVKWGDDAFLGFYKNDNEILHLPKNDHN